MSGFNLKQSVKLSIILALVCLISTPILSTPTSIAQVEADPSEYYNKSFAWDYNGNHWTWNLSIPKALYDAYRAVPQSTRTRNGPEGYGFLTTTEDYYIRVLAQKLNETTNNLKYNSYDKVSFILAFVQSLPYTSDNVTTAFDEYPRFPIETLVDDGGDCEDTSVLFASLTLILGYGTVYINPPNHYAVGVLGNNLQGTYWEYPQGSNKTYYYCETTGSGFRIGQIPTEFSGTSANIFPIDSRLQFIPNITLDPTIETPNPTEEQNFITKTTPSPTQQPNPSSSGLPTVPEPKQQNAQSLSFSLISESPVIFIIIAVAIACSIGIAIWSVRRPKDPSLMSEIIASELDSTDSAEENQKFCIHCGCGNKSYASFCEKCGQKASE
jgi:hypothetical protein